MIDVDYPWRCRVRPDLVRRTKWAHKDRRGATGARRDSMSAPGAIGYLGIRGRTTMKGMTARRTVGSVLAALAMLGALGTVAAEDAINFSGKDPSVDDVVEALGLPIKTRGIKPGAAVGATRPARPGAASFDQITFAFNSAELTEDAQRVLDVIGKALNDDRLEDVTFKIEGHTDGKGSAGYNLQLSKRRAESTRNYLVSNSNIDSERLKVVGKGFSDLLYKEAPEDARNRRVVIRSTTGR